MRWQRTMKAFWRLLKWKTRSFSNSVRCVLEQSPPLKNPVFNASSTLASATPVSCQSHSNTMALTQADGRALIRSISRISPVEIRRKRHLRTQWLRPMVTSSSTATRLRLKRVSSSGWQDRMMSSSSFAREKMSTPSSHLMYTTAQSQKQILWNGSLVKPVFWV